MSAGTEIISARRYGSDGQSIDLFTLPMSSKGCRNVAAIWLDRLHKGRYTRIELHMANGQTVTVKPKAEKSPPGYHAAIDTLQPRPEAGDAT